MEHAKSTPTPDGEATRIVLLVFRGGIIASSRPNGQQKLNLQLTNYAAMLGGVPEVWTCLLSATWRT
jgi:hypothetical protein